VCVTSIKWEFIIRQQQQNREKYRKKALSPTTDWKTKIIMEII